jgi:hypothetical protein
MNLFRISLALSVMCLALTATAAPLPETAPDSKGPISDALRMRGKLPEHPAPKATRAVLKDDKLEVDNYVAEVRPETRTVITIVDGKEIAQTVTVYVTVVRGIKMSVPAKDCKFHVVAKEGKLEAIDAKKAASMLAKETAVLTGQGAEVDPRHLEMVKPGMVYVMLPATPVVVPTPIPDKRDRD